MTSVEKRKIICSVTFHIIAITCVVWSLYVLIDRTTEEMRRGVLEWPFWTKIIVVAIGFTGGLVFMYVQCKMYVNLCHRWRAYNRVIYIENIYEHPSENKLCESCKKDSSSSLCGDVQLAWNSFSLYRIFYYRFVKLYIFEIFFSYSSQKLVPSPQQGFQCDHSKQCTFQI